MADIRLYQNALLSSPVDADIIFTGNSASTPQWIESQTTFLQLASYVGGKYQDVSTTSATLSPFTIYFSNNASQVTFALPSSLTEGQWFRVQGKGAGGWLISQNSGQQILWTASIATTSGVSGSLASTDRYDSTLLYVISSTQLVVTQAKGNITVT